MSSPQWRKLLLKKQNRLRLKSRSLKTGQRRRKRSFLFLRSWTVKRVLKSPTATMKTLTTMKKVAAAEVVAVGVAVGEERAGQTLSRRNLAKGAPAKGALEKGVHVTGVLGEAGIVRRAGTLKLRVIGSAVLRVEMPWLPV